MHAPSSQE